ILQQSRAQTQAHTAVEAASQVDAGVVSVPYVPDVVREQLRDDVRREVMAQAQSEHWAAPNAMPEWTQRITLSGDVRLRSENRFFSGGNDPFVDFNKINHGSPYNLGPNPTDPPWLNTNEDRDFLRIRARLGLNAHVADSVDVGLRVATGSDT